MYGSILDLCLGISGVSTELFKNKSPILDQKCKFHMGLIMLEIHKGCTIDTRHHEVYSSVFKSDKKIIFVKLQFSEVMTAAILR